MGQKVNPKGLRLGITENWESNWYAPKKEFGDTLNKDLKIRKFLAKELPFIHQNQVLSSVVVVKILKN